MADHAVAVIGMAGRFPGAGTLEQFWSNLRDGVESVRTYTREELVDAGVDPGAADDPNYVPAGAPLADADCFDAAFFGYQPREAEIMDPQHRLFLECAWHALEDAGYDPDRYGGLIGMFGGVARNTYLLNVLLTRPDLLEAVGEHRAMIASEKDYPVTRVAYKLNLRGPCINLQTACSTSGVAVHMACQSLLTGECDMALAGGGRVHAPLCTGYRYEEGGIFSPDGHCRAFDARAKGTVRGSGVAVVLLKRLEDALRDGDTIRAVIIGSAVNNDGSAKVGFTAPSVAGQSAVIREALAMAGVRADAISYVETHGTGTSLGDPIEIAALTKAFRETTDKSGYCAVGSVKTNLGHLDAGAAVAGIIKTVLALEHHQLPPSLHFEAPNPQIDFARSPFFVNATLRDWPSTGAPRRAGVSSFGLGGTNAHVVLQEAPDQPPSGRARPWQLLLLSAQSAGALRTLSRNLAAHLRAHPDVNLADVAYTLQAGRRPLRHRRTVVARYAAEAAGLLEKPAAGAGGNVAGADRPTVFMFTGQGAQYANMGFGLYKTEPAFRDVIDRCATTLAPRLGVDLRTLLYPAPGGEAEAEERLKQTEITQPALFAVEYALAELWQAWGVAPTAMVGHSLGEYVAACLAGVFRLDDALRLVAERGRLMASVPRGAMLAIPLTEAEVRGRLPAGVTVAVINGPGTCVASGPEAAVRELERRLTADGVACKRLQTSHAFHSAMMDPILEPFREAVQATTPRAPRIPFVSNVTGTWITDAEATDPAYWARQLREAVRFSDGLATLLEGHPAAVALEVGPGQTLCALVGQQPDTIEDRAVVASLRRPRDESEDQAFVLRSLGRLWAAGVEIDWPRFWGSDPRRRVSLPGYPFARTRHWVAVGTPISTAIAAPGLESAPVALGVAVAGDVTDDVTRRDRILAGVRALLSEVSGIAEDRINASLTFAELGFESLVLLEASAGLKRRFGVSLKLGRLMELGSPAALADYLNHELPTNAPAGAAPAGTVAPQSERPPAPRAAVQGAPGAGAMAEELEALRGEVAELRQALQEMATAARAGAPARPAGPAVGAAPHEVPLTDGQQEIWLAAQLGREGSCAFNLSNTLRLQGRLDLARLRRAVQRLVDRHESLRATVDPGGEHLRIAPHVDIDVPLVDLSGLSHEDRTTRLSQLRRADVETPFDLTVGPLIRATLIKLADNEHLLFLPVHHIVCDGWSCGVLLRDLGELYGERGGRAASRPMQISEYVSWYKQAQDSPKEAEAEAFWMRQFADGAPVLNLPTDRPRPPVKTYRAARAALRLGPSLTEELKGAAARHEVTLFAFLLAAFETLLHRLTGQSDLVIGISAAGQAMVGGRRLVGHCVNFLPLRMRTDGATPFSACLREMREKVLEGVEHQLCSFGTLLQKLDLPRDPSRNPLVSVIFNRGFATRGVTFEGLDVEAGSNARSFENFEVFANVVEAGDQLEVQWTYNTDLFDAATIERWQAYYRNVLREVAADATQSVGAVVLMGEAERRRVVEEWNATGVAYPAVSLHEVIAGQAARTPAAPAVTYEGQTLSYGEVEARANQLARRLRKLGVGPEVLVGICAERSPELVVGLLGVLKAGGAYVPLDPEYPKQRLAFMLGEARPPVLLTQAKLLAELPAYDGQVLCLDRDWAQIAGESASAPEAGVTPASLAYVIYTSGSTGQPKGAMNTHGAICNRLFWMQDRYWLTAADVVLQKTPFSFDVSVWEFFWPLMTGARLVLARPGGHRDSQYLAGLIAEQGVTVLHFVPSMLREFLETARLDESYRSLRHVMCSGEALAFELQERFFARCGAELHNLYGPTEAAVDVTHWTCQRGATERVVPIGRPVANTQIYILDAALQPVPIGVPGELHIGGVQVARGYLNRPGLTTERFIADPFSGRAGARLYKTGDLARWRVDGAAEFLGRIDDQVKIRGNRVELGEIETVLRACAEVRDVAVVVREDRPGDVRLVAYIVAAAGAAPAPGELCTYLRAQLPEYMVPQHFVELATLPLSPNGKLDRHALPAPDGDSIAAPRASARPETATEKTLAEVWAEVLHLDRVGIHDNFFDLGGHSLLANRMLTRLRRTFGVDMPLRAMFEAGTIAELGRRIDGLRTVASRSAPGSQLDGTEGRREELIL